MFHHFKASAALLVLSHALLAFSTTALPPPELVDVGTAVIGGLRRPIDTSTARSRIAVLVMHAEQDYLTFSACTELSSRGFTVLCANNDASKSGYMTDLDFEDMMLAVDSAMSYLRNQTEFEQVVLLGHSGGGAMLSAYQNIAENGLVACQGTEKLLPCSDDLVGLEPADGVMLIDANYGLSTMTLLSLNPAIEDERSGMKINETLDLYSPANGYSSDGSTYSASFTRLFQSAVAARMQRLIKHAQDRLAAINAGNGLFSDDEDLYIPDAIYTGTNNKFFAQDTRFLSRTVHAWPLLRKNGTVRQIIHSVRVPSTIPSQASSYLNGAVKTTIKRFLSGLAIRVSDHFSYDQDSFSGIDWNSSHMVPIAAVPGIKVPLLTMGMTGHWEYLNAEKIYLAAGSTDKSIAFVEGAQHTIDTCTACEIYPGEFGNTSVTAYNYMADWLGKEGRFV